MGWDKRQEDGYMNEQLAQALGIEFIRKKSRATSGADLRITKSTGNRYSFSFSKKFANKMGGYVRLAKAKDRIYIVPGCKNEYGFKLSGTNSVRKYVLVSAATIGFIDKFLGEHTLLYQDDLDAYYIRAKEAEK